MPIWCCRTRPISSARTASRCSTGRSAIADAAADAIRQPVVTPDRDVRPFQDVLIELGARLELPGLVNAGRHAALSRTLCRLSRQSRAHGPASACSRAGAAPTATTAAPARPIREQLERLCREWLLLARRDPARRRATSSTPTATISNGRWRWASSIAPEPIMLAALQRDAAELPPRRAKATAQCSRRQRIARASRRISIRCRSGIAPFEEAPDARDDFPLHAITQRPMAMYHSWGSQNAWLRQIHGENRLYIHRGTAATLGIADDDWVDVTSQHGAHHRPGEADGRRQSATRCGPGTRSASARGPGTSRPTPARRTRGFLLNHLIAELLPATRGGYALCQLPIR